MPIDIEIYIAYSYVSILKTYCRRWFSDYHISTGKEPLAYGRLFR